MFDGRYFKDEVEYVWSYCKKTGFDKYVTDEYVSYFERLILIYGFIEVQQAIRKIHKRKLKYPINALKEELYKRNLDYEALSEIPAYRAAQELQNDKRLEKELQDHQTKMLIGSDTKFREMETRKRLGKKYDGYWSFEEIERGLLGIEEIKEDKENNVDELEKVLFES